MSRRLLAILAACAGPTPVVLAQTTTTPLSITGTAGSYTENFDGMGTTGGVYPAGFNGFRLASTDGSQAVNAPLTPTASTGSGTLGTVYNFGTTNTSTDRALGSLATNASTAAFGAVFVNNTGGPLDLATLSFSFRVEQYRTGNLSTGDAAQEVWTFRYATGPTVEVSFPTASGSTATGLNYAEVRTDQSTNQAINGNGQTNGINNFATVAAAAGVLTGTVAVGDRLAIRWEDFNSSGSDAGVGIDDFSVGGIVVSPVPEPASAGLLATAGLALAGFVRRRRVG